MALAGCPDSFLHLPYRIVSYEIACSCQLVASYCYVPVIDCAFKLFIKLLIAVWQFCVLLRFSSRASVAILYLSPVEKIGSLTHNNLGHWLRLDTCPQNSQLIFERRHLDFIILSALLPSLPSPLPLPPPENKQTKKTAKKWQAAVLVKCLAPKRICLLNAAFVETEVEIFKLGRVLCLCCI